MIKGLLHAGINARDFDALLGWYTEVLGFKVDWLYEPPAGDGRIAYINAANGVEVLEMIERPNAGPAGPNGIFHAGFVVDDIDAEYRRLKELGVQFTDAPRQAKHAKKRVCHFHDPEGNRLHLTQVSP